jgi:ATP-dependent RNA circularization protein (DNA/RNA ligase family)
MNSIDLQNTATVYKVSDVSTTERTSVPSTVKSEFAEEYNVPYTKCYASMKKDTNGQRYVIVGCVSE